MSRAEETILAFDHAIDKAGGAAAFDELLASADKRITEKELDGVVVPLDEEEPGDMFATSVQITPNEIELVSGPNEEPYRIDRKALGLLISERLSEALASQVEQSGA